MSLIKTDGILQLLKNLIALSTVQVINIVTPFLILPYVLRVIGIDNYGRMIIAQSIFLFLAIIVDFGFNISAVRDLSTVKDDIIGKSKIVISVILLKLIIFAVVTIIVIICIVYIPYFNSLKELYLWAICFLLGQTLIPIWYYQGVEKMHFLAIFNFIVKLSSLLLVYTIVKEPDTYYLILPILGIPNVLLGILTTFIIIRYDDIKIKTIRISDVMITFQSGWHFFLATFTINIYVQLHIIILSFFTNQTIVGYYSIAERIVAFPKALVSTFNQSVYPMLYRFSDIGKITKFFRSIFKYYVIALFLVCCLLFKYADFAVAVFSGVIYQETVMNLRILAFVPFIIALHLASGGILLIFRLEKEYSKILFKSSILSLLINMCLVNLYGGIGIAWGTFIIELIILIYFNLILIKNYPQFSIFRK